MLEKLNSSTLLLDEEDNSLGELVALQSNHSSKVEDLSYGRQLTVFSNVNSNLQFKYLAFCLRYFTYFKINSLNTLVESYKKSLTIKHFQDRENTLGLANSLAVRFSKPLTIRESSSSTSLNTKKHKRQESSISSSSVPNTKRVKSSDLLSLSSIGDTSFILSSILKEFLGDNLAEFRSSE